MKHPYFFSPFLIGNALTRYFYQSFFTLSIVKTITNTRVNVKSESRRFRASLARLSLVSRVFTVNSLDFLALSHTLAFQLSFPFDRSFLTSEKVGLPGKVMILGFIILLYVNTGDPWVVSRLQVNHIIGGGFSDTGTFFNSRSFCFTRDDFQKKQGINWK